MSHSIFHYIDDLIPQFGILFIRALWRIWRIYSSQQLILSGEILPVNKWRTRLEFDQLYIRIIPKVMGICDSIYKISFPTRRLSLNFFDESKQFPHDIFGIFGITQFRLTWSRVFVGGGGGMEYIWRRTGSLRAITKYMQHSELHQLRCCVQRFKG